PFRASSILWNAQRNKIPCTVHVAIGTDFIHLHPKINGETLGATTFQDFLTFCEEVENLENGVYWNLGSAVIMPEIFLKAVSRSHNLGKSLLGMTTLDMDMIAHYRPITNVVNRPSLGVGKGFHITGHHEIMVPLLASAFLESLNK
ncbi:hypothetical protein HYY75_08030, partial [bacterium]|nr:hypothetical protein [bacterium]